VFSDHAQLTRKSFLYRQIEVSSPFAARLTYSGWWFRQVLLVDQTACWFRISWLKFHSQIQCELPTPISITPEWCGPKSPNSRRLDVQIDFTRGLRIRRFRIWLAGRILYDEIN